MSKIEEYKEAKEKAKRIKKFVENVKDTNYADKFGADITISRSHTGYYGNSSCYSWGEEIQEEVKKQIGLELHTLIVHAAERMEVEAEAAREAARSEALSVLDNTKGRK